MKGNKEMTGERLTPYILNENSVEHLHRYAMAMSLVENKIVLDIACGEGYGSNLLAEKALHVTGADIKRNVIINAKSKYNKKNINFIESDITNILVVDNTFDAIVCFETIEHIEDHNKAILEMKRVLKTSGILIISSPNKAEYSDRNNFSNPFHKKELYLTEFENLLKNNFSYYKIYEQLTEFSSTILASENKFEKYFTGDFHQIKTIDKPLPEYFIGLASDIELPFWGNSSFQGNEIIKMALAQNEKMITSTMSYKIGHFLLYPLKLLKKILGK